MVGVNRISGMISGLDTDSLVKSLVSAGSAKVNKLKQQQQVLEWKRADYRELNTKVLDFRTTAFNMKLQSAYLTKTATSSQDTAVSVTGNASATDGQYDIGVSNLAQGASLTSGKLNLSSTSDTATLERLGLTGDATLTIGEGTNPPKITLTKSMTFTSMISQINAVSSDTGIKATYDSTLDRLLFVSTKTGASSNVSLKLESGGSTSNELGKILNLSAVTGTASFTAPASGKVRDALVGAAGTFNIDLNGTTKSYTVTASTTVGQLMDQINANSGSTGLTAYMSGDKIAFNNASGKTLAFTSSTAGVLTKLGVSETPTASTTVSQIKATGQNAKVTFNGVEAEYESNTFTVAGMTVTAKATTTTPAKVVVSQNVDKIYDSIKSFVDKYNDLISTVNTKISETHDRDYTPLTDDQKEAMSDEEIEKWEAKAKVGMLSRDQTLNSGLISFRKAFSENITGVSSTMKSLSQIGISSTLVSGGVASGSYLDNGKIYIDETKLKQAIADNPDEVMKLFTANDGSSTTSSGDGLAVRLYDQANGLFNQITTKAGSASSAALSSYTIGKEMSEISTRISREQDRIEAMQDRYYTQFSRMESYLSQMNSQSSWLTQQTS